MKKTIILLAAIFTINVAETQQYYPLPDSNVSWNFNCNVVTGGGDLHENYSILISGDTLINNKTYHKLIIPFIQYVVSGLCLPDVAGYKGAIRQETENKKVFYVPPIDTTEQLLYDFAMQVGDTVKGYIEYNSSQKEIVQTIDSILVGDTYRKRWVINTTYAVCFIEGIGSTYGLIRQSPGKIVDGAPYLISCFNQNGQSLYPITATNCQVITSINSIVEKSAQLSIYPNPAKENLTIETNANQEQRLEILNLIGQTVYTIYINKKAIINTSAFANGVYILKIYSDKETIVKKFIKE